MILEIRTYRLAPGTRDGFVDAMATRAVPLLEEAGIRVVAHGPSLADEDGHEEAYLIRAFPSLEVRDQQEESFYGSEAWRSGPREAIVTPIESYHTIVIECPEAAVEVLTRS
jgi:hypothetical protein